MRLAKRLLSKDEEDFELASANDKADGYVSEANEDHDRDNYAQTLALGNMMLRRSKEKAFVDGSYKSTHLTGSSLFGLKESGSSVGSSIVY
jgi:hypothetical protein